MSHDHSQNHYGPNASFDGHDSDLAAAGILIESLRQQLSAALAACKLKDELITDACTAIAFYGEQPPQALFDALSMPCDDSALNAWLGEPAYYEVTAPDGVVVVIKKPLSFDGHCTEPLYTKPRSLK